jgi:exodeoxyribonuclease V alpha subunit
MTAFDAEVTIVRQRFANSDSGFAVLDAEAADGEAIVLVGPLIHLEARERARVLGSWVTDKRYGDQVKVSEARPLAPTDAAALVSYLRKVKHVGKKRAETLIERHGQANVLETIDRDPASVFGSVGLSTARANDAAASWQELRVTRQLHLLLAPHGLGYLVGRINEAYPGTAQRVINENPYELTRVFGVGFVVADRIARANLGDVFEIPGRPRAGVIHLLSEAEKNGSTCLPLTVLDEEARKLLGQPVSEDQIDSMVREGDVVLEGDFELGSEAVFVYRRAIAELEAELAERVLAMIASRGRLSDKVADISDTGVALTEEQEAAVREAFAHRLSVITGGPGTGKTATIRAIAKAAEAKDAKVLLMAPTGRAASRMREASGIDASTVHSALQWVPGEGPQHDEDDPLKADLIILDESSMANLELMVTLLRAISGQAHLVLVGDADQLAPIGAGKPFAEMLTSRAVPSTRLTHIFRQAAGSMIVQGAHAIRRGEVPSFTLGESVDGVEMRQDLFMMERPDAREARELIVELVSERLPKHYGVDPVTDIQVFAPVYKGDLGIDALNAALREKLNGRGAQVRGGRLRIGDKLMMTGRNLHELRLMNGTLLRLIDEIESGGDDSDDAALLLQADDGGMFRLPPEEIESLRLAYACSVHRGQGIELPIAIIVAHPAAGAFFLRREMLYTAVTRAKLATVIVGVRNVVARAAATPDGGRRHSRLAERLVEL